MAHLSVGARHAALDTILRDWAPSCVRVRSARSRHGVNGEMFACMAAHTERRVQTWLHAACACATLAVRVLSCIHAYIHACTKKKNDLSSPSNGAGTGTSEFHGGRLRSTALRGGGNVTAPCPCTPVKSAVTVTAATTSMCLVDIVLRCTQSDECTCTRFRIRSENPSQQMCRHSRG